MKYIRTKDGIRTISNLIVPCPQELIDQLKQEGYVDEIVNQSDTIEELCDEFVVYWENWKEWHEHCFSFTEVNQILEEYDLPKSCVYGAIWTSKGLIYVAKMNDEGELCLL